MSMHAHEIVVCLRERSVKKANNFRSLSSLIGVPHRAHATIRPKSATHPETAFNSTISPIPS